MARTYPVGPRQGPGVSDTGADLQSRSGGALRTPSLPLLSPLCRARYPYPTLICLHPGLKAPWATSWSLTITLGGVAVTARPGRHRSIQGAGISVSDSNLGACGQRGASPKRFCCFFCSNPRDLDVPIQLRPTCVFFLSHGSASASGAPAR
jgi:hypothetical protein